MASIKKKNIFLISLVAFAFVIFFVIRKLENQPRVIPPVPKSSSVPTQSQPNLQGKTDSPQEMRKNGSKDFPKDFKEKWEKFSARFGRHLIPEFTSDHFLISIQGEVGRGAVKEGDFQTDNYSQVLERANEIIGAVSSLIGIKSEWPVNLGDLHVGEVSAQIFFRQTYGGLQVKPGGSIKLDLGPHGEILGLYSSYQQNVGAIEPLLISQNEARERANAVFNQLKLKNFNQDSGSKIIWFSGTQAIYAFEFLSQGRDVVIDGRTGKVLMFRDIRIF